MQRNRLFRRKQRARVIRKRLKIILNAWRNGFGEAFSKADPENWIPFYGRPGVLGKYNLCCSCGLCRSEKYDRRTAGRAVRRLLDRVLIEQTSDA